MFRDAEEIQQNETQRAARRELSRDLPRDLVVEGVVWRVFEQEAQYDRRGRKVLVFESEAMSRFVRDFPANWRALSDEDLYRLS